MQVREMVRSSDRDLLLLQMVEPLERDGYLTLTYRIRHRDGHYQGSRNRVSWHLETYTGNVVEIVGHIEDITARVRAERGKIDDWRKSSEPTRTWYCLRIRTGN
ncbi:hypothetical protein P4S64_17920 [Vibrio sp. M60_M31a]